MPPGIQQTMTQLFCWHCGHAMTEDNTSEVTQLMCQDCVDEHVVWCDVCGDAGMTHGNMAFMAYRYNQRNGGDLPSMSHAYCEDAGEWRCDDCSYACECGEMYAYEDNMYSCCSEQSAVHNYGYTPNLMFYAPGTVDGVHRMDTWGYMARPGMLYMGVEIEVEKAYDFAEDFLAKANESADDPRFLYLKNDGSLDPSGMEIVTMPATLESFMHLYPLPAIQWLRNMGARAWNRTRCGMHVHLSRSAFTPAHLYKFIKFQSENSDKCIEFAGRDSEQWASWHNHQMVELQSKPSIGAKHRGGYADWCSRYSAINLSNPRTIELRYFRPNLNDDGAYRVVQFVQAMYDFTKQLTYSDIWHGNYMFSSMVEMMAGDEKYKHAYEYICDNGI